MLLRFALLAALAAAPFSPAAAQTAPGAPSAKLVANWGLTDLAAAQAKAKATGRPIVAVFSGSDWCAPCVKYEREVFAQPAFVAYAKDRLVLAHFDFPQKPQNQPAPAQIKRNDAAKAQLNREGEFPLAVVVAPDGKILGKIGYVTGGPTGFEAYLKTLLGK
ncbi:thioredoxin family protein [Hymenobacter nivis]|uniref:Thioredoxin family protein n=1 Tax=Hymenobacter nivis TaxID=1850093 RepID=A0A2Z3GNU2_9BACT|nr:thioredoxin family protein [Hymenobacter nivis]AWM33337.1 thioredoxin family protein [Hymenobacter nivis]